MTIEQITHLLGWSAILNYGILILSTIMLVACKGFVVRTHQKFFKLSEEDLNRAYFQYLAQFKILVIVFNIVPYLALRIMGV
jgi:hypothetical protein